MSLRIVAFDHFYWQDLDALEKVLRPEESLIRIDYRRLHRTARRHFSDEAFVGLANAYRAKEDEAWATYVPFAERFAERILVAHRPNVFVVPSDSFFYLRPVIRRLQELGLPCVVVQKETTISPMVMQSHSEEVSEYVPFMSDWMTVCSERHKDFWIRSGSESDRIVVTGQPRFDPYGHPAQVGAGRKILLYLSFDDVAYLPGDRGWDSEDNWREFRREVEETLALATSLGYRVLAKRHPQQKDQGGWLGNEVTWLEPCADTREAISTSDVVVGFQTTGLFEAMAAGKSVVYPAWGSVFERNRDILIPFHDFDGALVYANSPSKLRESLSFGALASDTQLRSKIIGEHLGPIDGHASERVLHLLRNWAKDVSPVDCTVPFSPWETARLRLVLAGLSWAKSALPGKSTRIESLRSLYEQQLAEERALHALR